MQRTILDENGIKGFGILRSLRHVFISTFQCDCECMNEKQIAKILEPPIQ